MTDPVAVAARDAAERLSPELGRGLVADVEAALASPETRRHDRFVEPISLGSLIVGIASFAWSVYRDMKREGAQPAEAAVARAVRVEVRATSGAGPPERDRIIDIVVATITEGD